MNSTLSPRFQRALPIPIATSYFVARDLMTPSGKMFKDAPLSRLIKRVGILRRVNKRILRHYPTAFMVEVRQYR